MTSTGRSYFDDMYCDEPDPWHFESSPYEQRKYALTIASLPRRRYTSAFEPGCSVGVFTELLAARCDRLVSTEIVPAALQRARTRLLAHPHVSIIESAIPADWPAGPFDLVVLSEIGYYFSEADLRSIMTSVVNSTTPGAHIVGVHWRGETDYPLTGERCHAIVSETPILVPAVHHIEKDFVLDIWERR